MTSRLRLLLDFDFLRPYYFAPGFGLVMRVGPAKKIDMHSHWRPAALIEAMRQRMQAPRIMCDAAGVEVIKTRNTEEPVSGAFDDVETRLAEMDTQGLSTAVLSHLVPLAQGELAAA